MLRRIIIWLLWCLAILIFVLTTGAAALWMAPRAVSTDWFRKQLESRASRALQRPVTIHSLLWTWKEGIQIEGLRIADDRAFSRDPLISSDRLLLNIDPEQLIERRLWLDLQMEGLKAHLIRGPDGRTNLEAWLSRIRPAQKPPAKAGPSQPKDWRRMALALPGDLCARVRVDRGALLVDDRQAARSLAIHDIALLLHVPSLLVDPVTLTLSSKQEMDGKALPPVDLALSVEHLVDATSALRLNTASIRARCTLPGLELALTGGLSDMGIEGTMDVDLAAFREAAGPLVPPSLPRLSGRLGCGVKARMGPGEAIGFDISLTGTQLAAEGGRLKERRIGPLALQISQSGTVMPDERQLNIARGELRFQQKTRLVWQGRVRQADRAGVEADLSMEALSVDLGEMTGLAGRFIPLEITTSRSSDARSQGIDIEHVHLSGILPNGPVRMALKGLRAAVPGLKLAVSKNGLSAEGLQLRVSEADVRIEDHFPTSLALSGDLEIRRLSLSGARLTSIHGLRVANVRVTARDLARSPKALLGMAGQISLKESARIEQVDAPGLAAVPRIRHDLEATILLGKGPRAAGVSARAAMEAPALRIDALSKRPITGGMHLEARIRDLELLTLKPLMADVGGLEARFRCGEMVDFHMKGRAAALGKKALHVNGRVKLDLDAAGALIPASMKLQGAVMGIVDVDWRFQGRQPTPEELKAFSDRGLSLGRRMEALRFLERAEVTTRLKDVGLNLPMKGGAALVVHGIRSLSPLTVTASSGLDSVLMEGNLAFAGISQLPGSKPFSPPLQATLAFKADQRALASLEISEALHIDPLQIDQDLQISLNRLGRLLKTDDPPTLTTLLRHLDATLTGGLRVTMGPSLAPFTPGLTLTGPLKAGLGLELEGGKRISARASLESRGLDVTAEQQAHIRNLTTDIRLHKTYGLQFEGEEKRGPGATTTPLSQKVLRPTAATRPLSGPANTLARRLVEDLAGRMDGRPSLSPSLSFDSVRLKTGRFPLELRHGEVQLRLARSLPSMDRFQFDTMGGTILGDLRISRQGDRCLLEMNSAFSGLDATTLLPGQAPAGRTSPRGPGEDTQISGQLFLQMPISEDSLLVMNNLSAAVRLTHIGSRTLERLLYAVDPYEANEGIVKQRALLRKGTPEWVDLQIRHGNLSLTGEVAAVGARLPLPPVERLNVTNMPIHRKLQKILSRLGPMERTLKAMSGNVILVGPGSTFRFVDTKR